ncbi:hypothetical protein Ahy_A06g029679 [Arachis hypogaea]|uniref:Pentatricopeptide repeat-containing protein n=1 Tax=Arachis hypogaea TaxID=3818 RepID=A0A445CU26_ARAHY|nr:hypothetical protein Ahy_A06g029679 [Arachis hypogaea]
MVNQGIRPDLITYNALIICNICDLEKVRKLVNEMSEIGLKSNKITFTTLIDRYCKDGDIKFVLKIKNKMMTGIELDEVAFTALILELCRKKMRRRRKELRLPPT